MDTVGWVVLIVVVLVLFAEREPDASSTSTSTTPAAGATASGWQPAVGPSIPGVYTSSRLPTSPLPVLLGQKPPQPSPGPAQPQTTTVGPPAINQPNLTIALTRRRSPLFG